MSDYKSISEEIKQTKEHLKDLKLKLSETIKMEIKEVLISKGFISCKVFNDDVLVDSTSEVGIDFRYIYENNAHLMLMVKRNDGSPYYSSIGNMEWSFKRKDNFETYYEKHIKQVIEDVVNGKKIQSGGPHNLIIEK